MFEKNIFSGKIVAVWGMFMKRPEDILYDLICSASNYVISIFVKPDMEVSAVTDILIDELIASGINGLIIDVDETLRFDSKDIPKENEEWLNTARSKFKIVILSNGMDKKLEEKFDEMGIPYIEFAFKPFKYNFNKSLDILGLKPEEVAVIGDDLFDDIYGGNKNDMTTIKVSKCKKLTKK